jgi:hypothetical protein
MQNNRTLMSLGKIARMEKISTLMPLTLVKAAFCFQFMYIMPESLWFDKT